jgi:hypothetical protein
MYQSEAMWIAFSGSAIGFARSDYPFAVKIAAGKIDAIFTAYDFDDFASQRFKPCS